jgi:hypothetical protein
MKKDKNQLELFPALRPLPKVTKRIKNTQFHLLIIEHSKPNNNGQQ